MKEQKLFIFTPSLLQILQRRLTTPNRAVGSSPQRRCTPILCREWGHGPLPGIKMEVENALVVEEYCRPRGHVLLPCHFQGVGGALNHQDMLLLSSTAASASTFHLPNSFVRCTKAVVDQTSLTLCLKCSTKN